MEQGDAVYYVIRIDGAPSEDLVAAFPALTATREPVQTVLHGHLDDQAALTSVLDHLDLVGARLVEVVSVPDQSAPPTAGDAQPGGGEA